MGTSASPSLGLYVPSQYQRGPDPGSAWDRLAEQLETAIQSGIASIMVGEHHASPGTDCFPPLPLLARISAYRSDLSLGTSVTLAALHHPVDLAASAAFLDVLTGGRFTLGVGAGFRREEFEAFGVSFPSRSNRMVEAIQVIRHLWANDEVDFKGEHFAVRSNSSDIRPHREAGPPIWIGTTSDGGIKRAAGHGDAWIIDPMSEDDVIERRQALYRSELTRLGKDVPAQVPRVVDAFVAPTTELALDRGGPAFLARRTASARARGVLKSPSELLRSAVLGSPEDVIRGLSSQVTRFGITHFSIRLSLPDISQEHILECIRLLGSDVLPAFEA